MQSAGEFLKTKSYFQLGILPTEQPNPSTRDLADWSRTDLDKAIRTMQSVDESALRKTAALQTIAEEMRADIANTLKSGGRIFICGCGATGRLALSLEYLWRRQHPGSEQVVAFMAGGDTALVHSLEGFEDYPERGARHLEELGFRDNDLLISSSEGGETPYVIGATERAAEISKRPPYFLFCNPSQILKENIERSRDVITSKKIKAREIFVGHMALSGSTRMQASTALMLMIGLGLLMAPEADISRRLETWIDWYANEDLSFLKSFIAKESETYQEGHRTIYRADEFAITVMTDTTERAPTFNLAPFDNQMISQSERSLTYLMVNKTFDTESSWQTLLLRPPRPLNWPEVHMKATPRYLTGFDFSQRALNFRKELILNVDHRIFEVVREQNDLVWRFAGIERRFPLLGGSELFYHLTLKMILNIHSTLVMGRLGRYESNVMTWVYPSNGKLVDRAARYSILLLERAGAKNIDYDEVVRIQFEVKKNLQSSESIVIRTAEIYLDQHR
jgi:N-acetylmuramic acid 6-phosphate etherase